MSEGKRAMPNLPYKLKPKLKVDIKPKGKLVKLDILRRSRPELLEITIKEKICITNPIPNIERITKSTLLFPLVKIILSKKNGKIRTLVTPVSAALKIIKKAKIKIQPEILQVLLNNKKHVNNAK